MIRGEITIPHFMAQELLSAAPSFAGRQVGRQVVFAGMS